MRLSMRMPKSRSLFTPEPKPLFKSMSISLPLSKPMLWCKSMSMLTRLLSTFSVSSKFA